MADFLFQTPGVNESINYLSGHGAIIAASLAFLASMITFFFTKRYELEREWREKKIEHYKEFLAALSDSITYYGKGEKEKIATKLITVWNTIALIASQEVIDAFLEFRQVVRSGDKSREKHDKLLNKLILAIRKDIKLAKKDDESTFNFQFIGRDPK